MVNVKSSGVQAVAALVAFLATLWVVLGSTTATWPVVVAGLGLAGMATVATLAVLKWTSDRKGPKACKKTPKDEKSEKVT